MNRLVIWISTILLVLTFIFPISIQAAGPKRIEVDLTHQRLYAFEGQTVVYNFPISSGKIRTPTVTGTFYPWIKLWSTRMIGGSKAQGDYYDLPGVPYVIYFYRGYAIHGTYWHNNFGHPMSHGCVNLRTADAKAIFYWATLSTPITIYGVIPSG